MFKSLSVDLTTKSTILMTYIIQNVYSELWKKLKIQKWILKL